MTLIVDPGLGLSGIILNVDSGNISPLLFLIFSLFLISGFSITIFISFVTITPVAIMELVWSSAFQLIIGFDLSVLIPNLTDSFFLIDSDVVKIIGPTDVFSPIHPLSVLNDWKLVSWLNQILNISTFFSLSFVNVIILVLSTPTLFTIISSAYPFNGVKINDIENNTTTERKIPLLEDFFMSVVFFIFELNFFPKLLFFIKVIFFIFPSFDISQDLVWLLYFDTV